MSDERPEQIEAKIDALGCALNALLRACDIDLAIERDGVGKPVVRDLGGLARLLVAGRRRRRSA